MTPMMVRGSVEVMDRDGVGVGGVWVCQNFSEDDFVISAGVVFFGEEDASVKGLDPEDGEELGAYGACAD
jgi:hypothetical protein